MPPPENLPRVLTDEELEERRRQWAEERYSVPVVKVRALGYIPVTEAMGQLELDGVSEEPAASQ